MKNLKEIIKTIKNHEKRISTLENTRTVQVIPKSKNWYKPGSTVEKIVILIREDFFNQPRSLKEIISELEGKDYHLKDSDLTLPLRRVVRKGLLRKTKKMPDGTISKKWLYVKK